MEAIAEKILKENGIHQIQFYKKDGVDLVPQSEADEFTIVTDDMEFFRGKMLKKKPFNIDYVLEFVAKKRNVKYVDYRSIFDGLNLPNVGYHNTTYGVGVEVIFGDRNGTIQIITEFLTKNGIEFTTEYSDALWVYRFKISKAQANIDRINELKNTRRI